VDEYKNLLLQIKAKILQSRTIAVLIVNKELTTLYWHIRNEILKKQNIEGLGAKIIEKLSSDLKHEFPEMKGFSPRNLK